MDEGEIIIERRNEDYPPGDKWQARRFSTSVFPHFDLITGKTKSEVVKKVKKQWGG